MSYFTNPHEIAQALRRIADDLDRLGAQPHPPIALGLTMHVCSWVSTDAERVELVDRYGQQLFGVNGEPITVNGSWLHTIRRTDRRRDNLDISVFTCLSARPVAKVGGVR